MTLHPLLEHARCALFCGDSKHLAEVLPENSIDAIVTDPPAAIGFMGAEWDSDRGGRAQWIAWLADLMRSSFRVLKPGGYALVWAIPRTSHWTATALEDAGFEIRDVHHDILMMDDALQAFVGSLDDVQMQALARILESQTSPILYQCFGSGFPKSLDMAREYDMHVCEQPGRHYNKTLPKGAKAQPGDHLCPAAPDRDKYAGRTALKPAVEHWILARKPIEGTYAENVVKHGTGRLNVDGCRIGNSKNVPASPAKDRINQPSKGNEIGRTADTSGFDPNVGRWPAHLSLAEQSADILDEQSGDTVSRKGKPRASQQPGNGWGMTATGAEYNDSGGASRFFFRHEPNFRYVAKAPRSEKDAGLDHLVPSTGGDATGREDGSAGVSNPRAGAGRTGGARNVHPTTKSVALMKWLVRLVTPPGGTVLDPFAGSGTTGVAALAEGFSFIGCEMGGDDGKYLPIVVGRLRHALGLKPEAPEETLAKAGRPEEIVTEVKAPDA